MKPTFSSLLLLAAVGLRAPAAAQTAAPSAPPSPPALWRPAPAPADVPARPAADGPARYLRADTAQLAARLRQAPPETQPARAVALTLPLPDGREQEFQVVEVPSMEPALAARYPQLRTYAGRVPGQPALGARLTQTPAGLQVYLLTPQGEAFVAPVAGARGLYRSFSAPSEATAPLRCLATDAQLLPRGPRAAANPARGLAAAQGNELRTFRLALACTGEYAQASALGGGSVAGVQASFTTLVNNLNEIYERELAVRLVLAARNDQLIFLDPATDPFTSGTSAGNRLADVPAAILSKLNSSEFDLGHVVDTAPRFSGSGVAYLSVVCDNCVAGNCLKAAGSSSGSDPGLVLSIMRHEVGHQFGAGHTFNSLDPNICGPQRSSNSAAEPGSGVTIMSYAGNCGPDNTGNQRFANFHAVSRAQMQGNIVQTCAVRSTTGNNPPAVTLATRGLYIPKGTPFVLRGSGTDPDNDPLTYDWEEVDIGRVGGPPNAAATTTTEPLFRFFPPSAGGNERTFPQIDDVRNNTQTLGEILPQVPRTMRFALTARDSRTGGTGLAWDSTNIKVANSGPFVVTAGNAAFTAQPNSTFNLTWDVAGTDAAPVSCANVRVLFSTDGGRTFPTTLLASTPNDGAATVRFPNVQTTQGRLRLEAVGNVFFDLNDANITLSGTPLPVELVAFAAEAAGPGQLRWRWTTASERHNRGFDLELRAEAEEGFRPVAHIPGQGTATAPTRYEHLLKNLAPGRYYCRLHQLDADGAGGAYGPVVAATVGAPAQFAAELAPNPLPTGSVAAWRLQLPAAGRAQLVLLDARGRTVLSAERTCPAGGLAEWTPALPPLAPGLYAWRVNFWPEGDAAPVSLGGKLLAR